MQAILKRPAHHEVDRRLLFIEPHPEPLEAGPAVAAVAPAPDADRAGSADLDPRQQPIADALLELARYNQRVLQIKHLIEVLKPKVDELIQSVMQTHIHDIGVPPWGKLEAWREEVRERAEEEAGAATHSYAALKINGSSNIWRPRSAG